jgi:Flp pilus assembly pilin Flp
MSLPAHQFGPKSAVDSYATDRREFVTRLMKMQNSERGASMVEYSLLVVLIAIVAFVAVQLAGGALSETYSEISSELIRVGS